MVFDEMKSLRTWGSREETILSSFRISFRLVDTLEIITSSLCSSFRLTVRIFEVQNEVKIIMIKNYNQEF